MSAITSKASPRDAGRLPVLNPVRAPAIPCVRSEELFSQGREVLIEHSGCYYRLRMTHSNKLILTK